MKVQTILAELEKKHPGEVEYHQAVKEVLESIEEVYNENPRFAKAGILQIQRIQMLSSTAPLPTS
jgi:glutamate dehydrogenase (NADP+)